MEIRVVGLKKVFGHSPALHGVDLTVVSGELLALLGPSGSGKTTLLRSLAGLETPSEGQIFFDQEEASLKTLQERQVGFVFQTYALFRHMTVAENIAYGLRVRSWHRRPSKAEIKKRVTDLLSLMQLAGFESRYPAQLSGGQRQRVALARALAVEPRVLLLDEPFGALDAQVRKDLRRWLRDLHREIGLTTIFVTHDQDEALELSDRVALLNQGRLEQIGTPHDVYDSPKTPFVYEFVGESNRLEVMVRHEQVWFKEQLLPLPVANIPSLPGPGVLFFRPEQGELLPQENVDTLPVYVQAIHRVGPVLLAEVKIDLNITNRQESIPLQKMESLDVHLPFDHPFTTGQKAYLRLRHAKIFSLPA